MAQSLYSRPHARHITVVIRAPDINNHLKSAVKFILMIGDVGGKISRFAVFADDNPVFFISEISGFKPQGLAIGINKPLLPQFIQKIGHAVVFIEFLFAEIFIKYYAKIL